MNKQGNLLGQLHIDNLRRLLPGQRRSESKTTASRANSLAILTQSAAPRDGNRRGIEDRRSHWPTGSRNHGELHKGSKVARVWRFVLVSALALSFVLGAIADVAQASAAGAVTTTLPAGSYSGDVNGYFDGVAFYVSNSQTALQNITVGGLTLKCAHGTTVGLGQISVDSVPLKSGGSFNTTTTEQGVYNGSPATYKINFKGKLQGLKNGEPVVIGSIAETLGLANGGSCSSGSALPWTVTRDATQTVTAGLPPAGSYSGNLDGYFDGVAFYVSNSQTALQNITVGGLTLKCAPGSTVGLGDISVDSVPLNSDGSFNTTTTEQGVYNGSPATYKITFQGYFHGLNSSGVARAAGSVTETMTYTDGTSYSCSSGPEFPWTVTRDATQTVTTGLPPVGSYSGNLDGYFDGVAFYVSNTKTALQNLTVGGLTLNCAPGTTVKLGDISVDSVPLNSDGSFNTTTTEQGVYNGSPATYKITFQGYFHGLNSSGVARAAGSVTETMTYTHGTSYSCSSGPEFPWTVTRDATQTVTTALPPAGSYSGNLDGYFDGVAFRVSNTKTALQNITVGGLTLNCAPSGTVGLSNISVASVPLNSDGSFNTTTTEQGVYNGSPATYKITFQGYFHGLNSSGVARAAGSVTETMTYTHGTSYSCSSGPEFPWTVAYS